MHVYENNVYGKDVENGSILSGGTVVYRDHVNRAQDADQAAGTCERFVYSIVMITRLYDFQTWQTHFVRNSQRYMYCMWDFFLIVLFES